MKVSLLGTGTSQGIPVIGCECPVCLSKDPKDSRLRVSASIYNDDHHIIIDTGPDFRQQMLRLRQDRLHAIFITHEHNDHIIGLDDVRPYNFKMHTTIPVYTLPRVVDEIKLRFAYIFRDNPYPGAPQLKLIPIKPGDILKIGRIKVEVLAVTHGKLPILGFKIGSFAYLTDVKTLPDPTKRAINQLKHVVLSALHHHRHHAHMNLSESLELIQEIRPTTAYLTHISHQMGLHAEVENTLPSNVYLGYDGLNFEI